MKKMIMGLGLLTSISSFGAQVYTNDAVDLFENDSVIVKAYRSTWSCTNWYMTPAKYDVKSYMPFYGDLKTIKGKDNSFLGFGLVHKLNASLSTDIPSDLSELKEKIATHLNTLSDMEREKIYYKDCPRGIAADSIRLNSQTIYQDQNLPIGEYVLTEREDLNFEDMDVYSSAFDGGVSKFEFDISNPGYIRNLKDFFSKATTVGNRYYKMDSKEFIYGAYIQFSGKLTAAYEASLEKVECKTSSEENGMQIAAASGAGIGFMNGSTTRDTKTCLYEWVQQLKNAGNDMKLIMHFDKSRDFDSKKVEICDDNECTRVSLSQYVETLLLEKWLNLNFVADYKRLGDNLFNMKIRRKTGSAEATINNKVEISETQVQGMVYSAPIVSMHDKNFSVDESIINDESRICASENYVSSLIKHESNLLSTKLVPVPNECL